MTAPEREQRHRILVVDDDPRLIELMSDFLKTLPNPPSVTVAENGQVALDAVKQERPDLVLLDLNMPVMNGLDALKHIRALDPSLPVVLVSGADCRTASEGLHTGVFAYIPKPFDLRYMAHLVGLALRTDSAPKPS
jgi:two-component system, NtrC family, response regulator AtoC